MALWKQPPDLEQLNAGSRGTLMEVLGIRFSDVGDDYLCASMPVDARTHQPFGLLHGGASVALAETVGSTASMLALDPEHELAVGLDINANHVRGVRDGVVTATARALHLGRRTHVWEVRIVSGDGDLVCISRLTMAVVPRRTVMPR
ncbi:MAG TPA: hotdog fold thioesterase [Oleiagrimonas sp.]|nr:hotdog fold thioesterase [Oleiagrimonas sp.]